MSSNNNNKNTTQNNTFSKYLKKEEIVKAAAVNFEKINLVSNDTINEKSLLNAVIATRKVQEVFCAVLQMAIIGYGSKQFNDYSFNNETKSLKKLFTECKIKSDYEQNAKLDEGQLTPRRLMRLFRFQINEYLKLNENVASYLFVKYSKNDMNFRTTCFPGAEHMITEKADGEYLYLAYLELDESLKHRKMQGTISERIKRVLLARNVLSNSDFSRLRKEYISSDSN